VADQVLDDFQWALAVRQAGSGRQRQRRLINLMAGARRRPAGAAAGRARPPGAAGPPPAPGRGVPLRQRIAVRGAAVIGEVYLLSYTRVASGPQLSVFAQTRGQSGRWEPAGPRVFDPFTATDDQGTSYQVTIRDIGSPVLGWTLMLGPDPPHDP